MKRLLLLAAVGLLVMPALAGVDIRPINGVESMQYNMATGERTPVSADARIGAAIWSAPYRYVNYFWGSEENENSIDWGDIGGPSNVGGFGFAEFTNSQAGDGDVWAVIAFFGEENGVNSVGRIWIAGYLIDNIPGSDHPVDEYWGFQWQVKPNTPFIIDGSDLDGDGLVDWGYWQDFGIQSPNSVHGPAIAGLLDPNNLPPTCPGVEDIFDLFGEANYADDPNMLTNYVGTYYFGGPPVFSQWYFELYAPECPNRGDAGRYCSADIDGSFDCIVGLADLAVLLGNYGTTTGATPAMGDVDPYDVWFPGDGDVDLADLAELLLQYGNDCNWP